MKNFWKNCGHSLLALDANGQMRVTDSFINSYLDRPEIIPVSESCEGERALHYELKKNPRKPVSASCISKLKNPEGRENYRHLLDFRNRLIRMNTIESCYLNTFKNKGVDIPPVFLDEMVQIILRQILDCSEDAMQLRAAEIFFREQRVIIEDGSIILGDAAIVKLMSSTAGLGSLGELLLRTGNQPKKIELDVLHPETPEIYWERDDKFDMALDITFGRAGAVALSRVMEGWIKHMLGVDVVIQPVQKISDERWTWHIGLDVESTSLLNDLYEDNSVTDERMEDLLSLFCLEFTNPTLVDPRISGRPVYLGLCRRTDGLLRFKPQNLLVNLPLASKS